MNKKLLAVAVAAALAAPLAANADSGNVKIYGGMHVSVDSLDNGAQRNINASSNSSYIGFTGTEDLGNGLKAAWQLETEVALGATGPTTTNAQNTLTNRNSYLGLAGGFGTAIVGKHDTPVKILGRKADMFGDQIGDSRNLISDSGATGANWDLRPSNVIAYISPTMGGVHGAIAYVTNYGTAGNGAATDTPNAPTVDLNAVDAWSGLVIYEGGPAMVGLGYERHNLSKANNDTTTVARTFQNDEKIWRLVGGYSFGDAKLTALYQKESDLAGSTNSRKTWGIGAGYKMGATTIKAQYYNAADISGTSNTGANMWALGADYALSKRTTAYAAYAKTSNDDAANFSASGGGHGDNVGAALDSSGNRLDSSGVSFGLKHSF